MPGPDFFRKAGLFTAPHFLPPELVETIRLSMAHSPTEPALIIKSGQEYLDEDYRKVNFAMVSKEVRTLVDENLRSLIPQLEEHFHMKLGGCETPHYLVYHPGDFFRRHTDGGRKGESDFARRRRISVVIFLNAESEEPAPGTYGNGRLTFYGLLEGPHWEHCAFALQSEPGLLVAFPAEMPHEVTPVSHGERYTIASWYYAPDEESS